MLHLLKDSQGNILGMTRAEGRRENIYDSKGKRLGYFDGTSTFDVYSNKIGEGNILVLLLKVGI